MKKIIIVTSIGILIFLTTQFPHAMINPGELTEAHQKLSDKCFSCHKPFGGISNEKCTSCHTLTDIGKDSTLAKQHVLFHQNLSNQKCSSCHSDHKGKKPDHSLTNFKHELLAGAIISNCNSCHNKPSDNLHAQVATTCNNCHNTNSWKNSTPFNHEMLINKYSCSSCHQKPNDNIHSIIKDSCNNCHNSSQWVPSTFNHSKYFQLDENHNAKCNTCHTNNNFTSYSCYTCHEHSENRIIAKHNEEGIYNINKCASCHKSGNEHDIEMNGNNNQNMNEKEIRKIKEFDNSSERKENDDD